MWARIRTPPEPAPAEDYFVYFRYHGKLLWVNVVAADEQAAEAAARAVIRDTMQLATVQKTGYRRPGTGDKA